MKKFITFFVMIYNWILSLFVKEEKKTLSEAFSEAKKTVTFGGNPSIAPHNNRKSNRGRFTQYINLEGGGTRPIYHSVIKN